MSIDQHAADAGSSPKPAGAAAPDDDATAKDTGLGKPVTQSADPIDRVVQLAPRWTIFALIACALLVVGATVWAFNGVITQGVSTRGIYKDNGYIAVKATQDGVVTKVYVEPGQDVKAGDPLVHLDPAGDLLSPSNGTVSTLYVTEDSQVRTGAATVAITDLKVKDVVYTLLPSNMIGSVVAGLPAQMDVSSAPATTYGYLKGKVVEVSSSPLTTDQVAEALGLQKEIVMQALGASPGLLAAVGLESDPNTPSGYAWTVGEGPDFQPVQGTPMTVKVIQSQQHPIQLLFPSLASSSSTIVTPAITFGGLTR